MKQITEINREKCIIVGGFNARTGKGRSAIVIDVDRLRNTRDNSENSRRRNMKFCRKIICVQ